MYLGSEKLGAILLIFLWGMLVISGGVDLKSVSRRLLVWCGKSHQYLDKKCG